MRRSAQKLATRTAVSHRQFLAWHRVVLPDQRFTIDDVVVDATRGATRWTLSGTHRAEFLGIPPTQRRIAITGQDFFRLSNGQIRELWRSMDLREMVRQLTADDAASGS
jgi:steroid delta-isomerase-like uncharacterized protein